MTDMVQEISENYDLEELNTQTAEIDQISTELEQLFGTMDSIQQFGMNPSAAGVLKASGLLAGTSFDALAIEALAFDGPDGAETQLALEALDEKADDKATTWSAKIVHFVKTAADKVMGVLDPIWTKIKDLSKSLVTGAWDKTKLVGQTIKAHPFKTVAAVVTAAVGVAAVAAFVASRMEGAYVNETALESFVYGVKDKINAIKSPFSKVTAKVVVEKPLNFFGKNFRKSVTMTCDIEKVTSTGLNVKDVATIPELGWTQSAVKTLTAQLSYIFDSLKSSFYTAGLAVAKFGDKSVRGLIWVKQKKDYTAQWSGTKAAELTGSDRVGMVTFFTVAVALSIAIRIVFAHLISLVIYAFQMMFHTLGQLRQKLGHA